MDARGHAALDAVTGHFTGTTDEIPPLQWGAYKWGFDPDLYAQMLSMRVLAPELYPGYRKRRELGDHAIKVTIPSGTCPRSPQLSTVVDPTSTHSIQAVPGGETVVPLLQLYSFCGRFNRLASFALA